MPQYIAERKLIAIRIDSGERREVTYRVGTPYWAAGEPFASCPVEFEGIFEKLADAKGVDELQAIYEASNLDSLLIKLRWKYEFYWLTGDPYFDEDTTPKA